MALLHDASTQPNEFPPLTPVQREIILALEGKQDGVTHVHDRPDTMGPTFYRVSLGIFGIASLAVGTVAVFFFTIFGAILLFLGSAACVYALQAGAARPRDE